MSSNIVVEDCNTLDDFIQFVRSNPKTNMPDIFEWCTNERGCCDEISLVNALVKESLMDVDHEAIWRGELHEKRTMLLSAAEYRDDKLVQGLLELGADVNYRADQSGENVFDALLQGHGANADKNIEPKYVLKIVDIILPYNPIMEISANTRSWIYLDVSGYTEIPRLAEFISKSLVNRK